MAASASASQIDDQTDEDFFDRLVDDEFDGSDSKPQDITRVLSNLSLGDVNTSLDDSGEPELGNRVENSEKNDDVPKADEVAKEGLPLESANSLESTTKSDGSKGTSVKVVQWSAFSVDNSQEFEKVAEFEPYSEFLTENPDGFVEKTGFVDNPIESFSSNVGSTEQQDAQNDPQYWENLYPGWKFDASTGQWYQVDSYDATNNPISDNSNLEVGELVSESSGVSYLQQTSQSVLETVAEDCTVGSVSNWSTGVGSQQSVEYPPNMVFDPQYPEWYYDTNTQQWYSLESYTQSIQSSSNAVQDQSGFNSEQNHGFYSNVEQSEQHVVQSNSSPAYGQIDNYTSLNSSYGSINQSSQDFGQTWNASKSNYDQNTSFYNKTNQPEMNNNQRWGSQEIGKNWGKSMSNHSQQDSLYSNISQSTHSSQDFGQNWDSSTSNYAPQNTMYSNINQSEQYVSQYAQHNMWQPQKESWTNQQPGFRPTEPVVKQNYGSSNGVTGIQSFAPKESMYQFNQPKVEQTLEAHLSNSYYGDQNTVNYSQQSFQGSSASFSQYSYAPTEGRSSTGRPPHALVAFGFGGKLVVMKDVNSAGAKLDYGKQGNSSGEISVLNLSEIVTGKGDASGFISGNSHGYFSALCQQSFPGPLVGGSAAAKDVNKWIDEKIGTCESASMDFQKGEFFKLLFSLLKIMCQHYGKLRAPFGVDPSLEEIDGPESAVARLFASARKNGAGLTEFGSLTHSLQNLPLEGHIRATAIEVQNLLVSGRRKEALQCAQEGQLWGPALVLAAQLGEKFYVDTVKKMAQNQFVYGSPLRTLCLLIAGQPADIFSSAANGPHGSTQVLSNGMLDQWEDNLAIITANRTKDDELVIIHLGDCLLKERGQIIAAHTCYLVAETNFESYSDSARLCLIGADHWKCPRTYASPEAIQRTEVYEYSKVLGNSQFVLLPFQAYKIVYAYMLAEVGNVSDSLRYCQASLKLLKNSGRTPEVEMWKSMLSSLEERLRTHQQGGYGSNSAPAKLVGKLFTSIDRSIHRMMGAPPASQPPIPQSSGNSKESFSLPPKVASSHSTMAMSSLVPSASVEAISEWAGDGSRKSMHNRSISEPDFGRSPKQDAGSPDGQRKQSGAPSRFGRIGSQLLQKTMGWVSRPRSDRQAKLGETNKFYYDEKLKRWVEEGVEPLAEETALPPPPTAMVFQNGTSDYNINSAFKNPSPVSNIGLPEMRSPVPSEPNSGIPPIPPSQNQFSARARMGVRSRYVDTFNKGSGGGGALMNSFQSPSAPSIKPTIGAKFFVPTMPAPSDEPKNDTIGETTQDPTNIAEPPSVSKGASSSLPSASPSSSPPPPPPSLQRFPSLDNLTPFGNKVAASPRSGNGSVASHTRSSSWGGSETDVNNLKATGFMGGSPPHFPPQNPPPTRGFLGDELQEVEL